MTKLKFSKDLDQPHQHIPEIFTDCDGCDELQDLETWIEDSKLLLTFLETRREILTRGFDQVEAFTKSAIKHYSPRSSNK